MKPSRQKHRYPPFAVPFRTEELELELASTSSSALQTPLMQGLEVQDAEDSSAEVEPMMRRMASRICRFLVIFILWAGSADSKCMNSEL